MAFDISIDKATPEAARSVASFDEFYDTHADTLARSLSLACDDDALAKTATREALARTAQQWKRIRDHPNVLGWALHVGVEHADKVLSKRGPIAVNAATGGYVRGLPLDQALAALPLHQRTALVMAYHLGWSDQQAAAGAGGALDRASTLRTRAITFIAHHLHNESSESAELAAAHFRSQAENLTPRIGGVNEIRTIGRRRTIRNWAGAVVGLVAVIMAGAALLQLDVSTTPESDPGPAMVRPPSNSSDWLAPVSDGQGGFIALNTARASRFARSADGEAWFDDALWNSRAIDLRIEVSGFKRTGGRYVAFLEAPASLRGIVNPYIATSDDLTSWAERQVGIEVPEEPDGLGLGFEVLSAAFAEPNLLVALAVAESIDYASLGVASSEVCVEVTYDALLALHLCDGEIKTIERPSSLVAADQTRLLISSGPGPFSEITLPPEVDARSLVSDGARFAATNATTGQLWTSIDGRNWIAQELPVETNRFVLVEGDSVGQELLAVVPSSDGWKSIKLDPGANAAIADLELTIDPSSVWTKPELAAGPAGWALFVTTSRPWERVENSRGWAVDTGTWIVSRLPNSVIVTAHNEATRTTYRFIDTSELVEQVGVEGVILTTPVTDDRIVEITDEDIAQSRSTGLGDDQPTAQVFFSPDGLSWRSIWQTTEDTWFGSVAVGDDHVLISGATLTGPPIAVPLDQ